MTLVIDASVASKWVLPEDGAEHAARLREEDDNLIAPVLIVSEIGNAVWKRVMWREMPQSDAVQAVEIAVSLVSQLVPLDALMRRALEISIALRHPIYDCFYLALAEREGAPLVSADAALVAKGKKLKGVKVRAL
jgi:predicted nucleic acid-binding protein